MFAVVALLAALTAADSVPAQSRAALEPGAIVVHRQPSVPLVSLRLSILADDPPGFAGSGHLIQHLAFPILTERARRVGGRAQVQRTSDALVYTVTGPATELNYLASTLTRALELPDAPRDAMLRVTREVGEERLAEWETAPGHARSVLKGQLFPADISAAGTDRSAARFSARELPSVWASIYDPSRVSVVAVGDVVPSEVRLAFANLPPPPDVDGVTIQRDSILLGPLAPAQATRAWYGVAYLATELDPAALTVTARLLREQVQERVPQAQVEAEHWWSHHGQAIVILGAAPENRLADLRRAMDVSISQLLRDLDFLSVVDAASAARHELLFYTRTPDHMAEVIGMFVDRDARADAAERYFADLGTVDDRDVRAVLEDLDEATPARVEIPPQVLRRP